MSQLIQCVPNFSEGVRTDVLDAIVAAVAGSPGVRLVDWSADSDHNRMVVTFIGPPEPVRAAALAVCAVAIGQIDLRAHKGVHPRLGAVDVLPFVPIRDVTLGECAAIAKSVGQELAARHQLPVFLYADASPALHPLPLIRKEAFKTIAPDYGPAIPHPTAGSAVVGARGPLVAYNVNLATSDIRAARTIAREIREQAAANSPLFMGVRALGLMLASRSIAQVSMNVTRPDETPILPIFQFIQRRAEELGTSVLDSEVIGALPGYSAFGLVRDALKATGLKPGQILFENWPDGMEDDSE